MLYPNDDGGSSSTVLNTFSSSKRCHAGEDTSTATTSHDISSIASTSHEIASGWGAKKPRIKHTKIIEATGQKINSEVFLAAKELTRSTRTRREVSKEPNNNKRSNNHSAAVNPVLGGYKKLGISAKRSSCGGEEKEPRRKFSVSLTKAEIKEDLLAMTGKSPASRPKKRPRGVQKKIDEMSPAHNLSEVTADLYKVEEQLVNCGKK